MDEVTLALHAFPVSQESVSNAMWTACCAVAGLSFEATQEAILRLAHSHVRLDTHLRWVMSKPRKPVVCDPSVKTWIETAAKLLGMDVTVVTFKTAKRQWVCAALQTDSYRLVWKSPRPTQTASSASVALKVHLQGIFKSLVVLE